MMWRLPTTTRPPVWCPTADVYLERGQIHAEEKRWEKALADFSRFIRLRPKDSAGYYWRAQAYRELGRKSEAEADDQRTKKCRRPEDSLEPACQMIAVGIRGRHRVFGLFRF